MPPADHHGTAWLDELALGRRLSRLEEDAALLASSVIKAYGTAPGHRIGITGSPGVGKSTLLAQLLKRWDAVAGMRTGLVAVDPTSVKSQGAVLGDRFRFADVLGRAFARSVASRSSLGGMSPLAVATVAIMEEAGLNRIVIETVGLGQLGSDIRALADTLVVLLSPESGDSLQMLKAGPIELGDIFVINKADRPGADNMLAQLREALQLVRAPGQGWSPVVLTTAASLNQGIEEVGQAMSDHQGWLAATSADATTYPRILQHLELRLQAALRSLVDIQLDTHQTSSYETVSDTDSFSQMVQRRLESLLSQLRGLASERA